MIQWKQCYFLLSYKKVRSVFIWKSFNFADSLVLDKENKNAIDLTTATGFDQLKSIKTNHKERISIICDKSEQCIHRDYLVCAPIVPYLWIHKASLKVNTSWNIEGRWLTKYLLFKQVEQVTNLTPKKREIPIPSMESIEEMKANVNHFESIDISRPKGTDIVSRNLDRTPFQDVNGVV